MSSGRSKDRWSAARKYDPAIVCRWRAPLVVLGGQAIDRDHKVHRPDRVPLLRNGTSCAGDQLHFDSHAVEKRQKRAEFAIPDQGLAADNRYVNRADAAYDCHCRGSPEGFHKRVFEDLCWCTSSGRLNQRIGILSNCG